MPLLLSRMPTVHTSCSDRVLSQRNATLSIFLFGHLAYLALAETSQLLFVTGFDVVVTDLACPVHQRQHSTSPRIQDAVAPAMKSAHSTNSEPEMAPWPDHLTHWHPRFCPCNADNRLSHSCSLANADKFKRTALKHHHRQHSPQIQAPFIHHFQRSCLFGQLTVGPSPPWHD